ncbi:MAG: hypothetical protein IJ840_00545 [Bacteroidales bacterium]|nr:hypothetical protein [Bacteroidales bacterium]
MLSEKNLKIISAARGGTPARMCREILGQTGEGQVVLSLVFFVDASRETFESVQEEVRSECRAFFGGMTPMVTCISQKPLGAGMTAEVLYLTGDGSVEYGGDYLVIRNGRRKELITKGISFPFIGDITTQSNAVFARIGEILGAEGFGIGEIVRQWNYIEDITGINDGVQNYQLFNDARSVFYSKTEWPGGYPAATGIGCAAGGITVCVYAVKDAGRLSSPIDNPLQVPAHKYSGKVLVQGLSARKTTPKFERARLVGDTVMISGTAAIKGEDSDIFTDPARQTEAAIEVVESLIAPANIRPGNKRFSLESLRVFVKRERDAEAIVRVVGDHWKGVPVHYMLADVCRPELLLEIEGSGTVKRFLECCCSDSGEAVEAQAGGAGRIELCEDLSIGGVTPSEDNIKETLRSVRIPVNVLVRPRGGDFVYSEEEILQTIESIKMCVRLGVNGVVVGALREDGAVDMDAMRRFMEAAKGVEITFHRAFDECADPLGALEDIISLGCDRLLTAGHAANVTDGQKTLATLREKASGRIIIMAGSGVRPGNIAALETSTGIKEFHSSSHGPDGRTAREVVSKMVHIFDI